MNFDGETLFDLLPALYRMKDAQLAQSQTLLTSQEIAQLQSLLQALPGSLSSLQQAELDQLQAKAARGPLQSLLMLIAEQVAAVEADLQQLYDDQFIETCAEWVIPYIGDLIGYQPVNGVAPSVASTRAEVAHTISFRRRKGTVLVLEQLARDVTGWGAHAVEFFKFLAVTQYMNHVRPHNFEVPNLRGWKPRAYMYTGFDSTTHMVDVRRIASGRGRYNIQNIGIFLWSLNAYPLSMVPPTPVTGSTRCLRFSSLGRDTELFNYPVSQGPDITAAAEPVNVPDRLRRHVLCSDIQNSRKNAMPVYYGAGNSLALYAAGAIVEPDLIQVADLSGDDGAWANVPASGNTYAVDPHLGRVALGAAAAPVQVCSYYYGFSGDMGGGEYSRANTFTTSPEQPVVRVPGDYGTVQLALNALGGDGVVEITDSGSYTEAAGVTVTVKAGGHIELRARDLSRPTLVLGGEMIVTGGAESRFDLNGLLITSGVAPASPAPIALLHVPALGPGGSANQLSRVGLTHCTLVPGWALTSQGSPKYGAQAALVAETAGLQVAASRSILGAMRVQALATASLVDSILDATLRTTVAYAAPDGAAGGGALTLQGCTVVGKVHATLLDLVSNSIVWAALGQSDGWPAALWANRKQAGCVRFSYIPAVSKTPRKYHCVTAGDGTPGPLFESLRYGDAGYGKLAPCTDDSVRRGADDGGEMGCFHFLLAPLRETDLRVRIQEYLPVGLEYGIFYQT